MLARACACGATLVGAGVSAVLTIGGLETVALVAVVVAALVQLRGALRDAGRPSQAGADALAPGASVLRVDLAGRGAEPRSAR